LIQSTENAKSRKVVSCFRIIIYYVLQVLLILQLFHLFFFNCKYSKVIGYSLRKDISLFLKYFWLAHYKDSWLYLKHDQSTHSRYNWFILNFCFFNHCSFSNIKDCIYVNDLVIRKFLIILFFFKFIRILLSILLIKASYI
jgi:hypothetical protein